MRRIEHLRALQAFSAAASRGSLSHAADLLGVTQGAVSRQVKLLEDYLGVTLFRRTASGVVMTEPGERLHAVTSQVFTILEAGIADVRKPRERRSLTISLSSELATKWLVPRLPLFRARHPLIEVFLDTTDEVINFDVSEVDVALRSAKPKADGLFWEVLAVETRVVVASPRLLEGLAMPLTPRDIAALPILNDDWDPRWPEWAALAGLTAGDWPGPAVRFNDSAVMITAALDGQGVALARKLLVADDIAAGRLVQLHDIEVPTEKTLNFVCRRRDRDRPNIRKLHAWLTTL